MILILSSPSGAGKTTLTRMLMQDSALDLTLSVSVTTRKQRPSEVDGIHYHFIKPRRIRAHEGGGTNCSNRPKCTATPMARRRAPVEKVLAQGRDMLFDIDWQGAAQVRERLGDDVVSIFVLPPSMRELRARLERRAEDTASSIEARFQNARTEIERWRDYHYVVVNDDLNRAYRDVKTIVAAERLRARRIQTGVEQLVERLMAE